MGTINSYTERQSRTSNAVHYVVLVNIWRFLAFLAVLAVLYMLWPMFWPRAYTDGVQGHGWIIRERKDGPLDVIVVFSVAIVAVMNAVGLVRGWRIARLTTVVLSVGLFWLSLVSAPIVKFGETPDPFAEPLLPALASVVALYSGWVVSKKW